MSSKTPTGRKVRKDKGTHRNNRDDDMTYAVRLSPSKPDELKIINAIADHFAANKNDSFKTIIMTCIGERLGQPLTKEAEISETLEQQIERLASAIDKLMSLNLQRGTAPAQQANTAEDVNMDYLKRIHQTLRGGKK